MDQSPVIKTDETSPWSPGDNQPVVSVVSASASVLVGRGFESRPGLTKTL